MAQSTVAAIKKGCQLLSEGKAEIGKLKSTVEKGVADARAIYQEVTGLWGWVKGLFGKKPKQSAPAVPPIAATEPAPAEQRVEKKANRRQAEPELTFEEYQTRAIHQVCEQLKTFFEIQRKLREHCRELEEQSKTTATIEDSAIDRVQIELQLENMTVQVREAMVYAPRELRDIYSRFLKMYEQILEEQEFDRQLKRKQERDRRWQREAIRNHRIDRALTLAWVLLVVAWMWSLMLSFGWLVRTPDGLP